MQVSAHGSHVHSTRHHQVHRVNASAGNKPAAPQAATPPADSVKISPAAAQAYAAHTAADQK